VTGEGTQGRWNPIQRQRSTVGAGAHCPLHFCSTYCFFGLWVSVKRIESARKSLHRYFSIKSFATGVREQEIVDIFDLSFTDRGHIKKYDTTSERCSVPRTERNKIECVGEQTD